jgi:hypothetical protein
MFTKQNAMMVAISLPKELFKEIEQRRGDISRSRYVRRVLEAAFMEVDAGAITITAEGVKLVGTRR